MKFGLFGSASTFAIVQNILASVQNTPLIITTKDIKTKLTQKTDIKIKTWSEIIKDEKDGILYNWKNTTTVLFHIPQTSDRLIDTVGKSQNIIVAAFSPITGGPSTAYNNYRLIIDNTSWTRFFEEFCGSNEENPTRGEKKIWFNDIDEIRSVFGKFSRIEPLPIRNDVKNVFFANVNTEAAYNNLETYGITNDPITGQIIAPQNSAISSLGYLNCICSEKLDYIAEIAKTNKKVVVFVNNQKELSITTLELQRRLKGYPVVPYVKDMSDALYNLFADAEKSILVATYEAGENVWQYPADVKIEMAQAVKQAFGVAVRLYSTISETKKHISLIAGFSDSERKTIDEIRNMQLERIIEQNNDFLR